MSIKQQYFCKVCRMGGDDEPFEHEDKDRVKEHIEDEHDVRLPLGLGIRTEIDHE